MIFKTAGAEGGEGGENGEGGKKKGKKGKKKKEKKEKKKKGKKKGGKGDKGGGGVSDSNLFLKLLNIFCPFLKQTFRTFITAEIITILPRVMMMVMVLNWLPLPFCPV